MARCRPCGGTGKLAFLTVTPTGLIGVVGDAPCPVCGGSGWEHCCEGDRAQPEPWSPGEACIPPMSQR